MTDILILLAAFVLACGIVITGFVCAYFIARNAIEKEHTRKYGVEHRGYILKQSRYNNHYMIFDAETGRLCMHCQYTKRLNKKNAKIHIDFFIKLKEMGFELDEM